MATTMQVAPVNPKNSAVVKRRAMTCGWVGTMPVASIDTNSLVFMTTPLIRNDSAASLKQRHALAHDFYSIRGVAGLRPRTNFYAQPYLPAQETRPKQCANQRGKRHAEQVPDSPERDAHLGAVEAIGHRREGSREHAARPASEPEPGWRESADCPEYGDERRHRQQQDIEWAGTPRVAHDK